MADRNKKYKNFLKKEINNRGNKNFKGINQDKFTEMRELESTVWKDTLYLGTINIERPPALQYSSKVIGLQM